MILFSLMNVPMTFMDLVNIAFHEFLDQFMVIFIEDILMYSEIEDVHCDHLRVALDVLQEQRFYTMFSKCEFWLREVIFLVYMMSSGRISIDPQRLLRYVVSLSLQDTTAISQKGFSSISLPLMKLMRKNAKFVWSPECEDIFLKLKCRLMKTFVLVLPSSNKGYVIFNDAFGVGLGCLIMQLGKVITYTFCQLKPNELNYPTHDLELVDIMFALNTQRHCLYRAKFEVYTNYKGLKYLLMQKDLNLRQIWWFGYIKDFTFTIFYHPGKVNVLSTL